MPFILQSLRRYGIDILIVLILGLSGYLYSQPLRAKWEQRAADSALAKTVVQKWNELTVASAQTGGRDGEVQLVELSDYECPFCRQTNHAVDSLIAQGVRVGFIHDPLRTHQHAEGAALAAICAEFGGHFRAMHERLMSTTLWQQDTNWVREAGAAGVVDLNAFDQCLRGAAAHRRLEIDRALADTLKVPGTPMFVSPRGIHRGFASTKELMALVARN